MGAAARKTLGGEVSQTERQMRERINRCSSSIRATLGHKLRDFAGDI
jgi:hypothetical protein